MSDLSAARKMFSAPCMRPAGFRPTRLPCAPASTSSVAWCLIGRTTMRAFEKPDGRSADKRHHVRFWLVLEKGSDGRPVWLGSVTFDRGVGLSHDTGQVTHHVAPDIDARSELLMRDLREAGMVQAFFRISGTGPTLFGRNGEGDPYYTDGEIDVASLVIDGVKRTEAQIGR